MFPPEIASALAKNDVAVLEPFFNKLQENTTQRFILGRGMWVHGATTRWEYFKILQAYSLADIAKNIQCPTFVAEAENDRRRGGGKDLYNALRCPKEYVLFAASEGACCFSCAVCSSSQFAASAGHRFADVLAAVSEALMSAAAQGRS
jgi:hypothetical protein